MTSSKPILKKSIYLIGPQSTGKTTLLNQLLDYYADGTPFIVETARKILSSKSYKASDLNSNKCLDMQLDIFTAHFQEEMKLWSERKFAYISDRSAIDPIIYSKIYCQDPTDWKKIYESPMWSILSNRYKDEKFAIVVLFEPIKTFIVDDGIRKIPENWKEMEDLTKFFKEFLIHEGIPFYTLGEECRDLKERVGKVVAWVDGF